MPFQCEKCKRLILDSFNYCPNCGNNLKRSVRTDIVSDIRKHLTVLGICYATSDKCNYKYIDYSCENDNDYNISLKVYTPVNTSVVFDICFYDSSNVEVAALKSSSVSLSASETILKVPFKLPAGLLNGYYTACIKYHNVEMFRLDLVPDVISVRVDDSWFNMRLGAGDYYKDALCFLTWWMLMPNTTSRGTQYMNQDVKLEEVAGYGTEAKCLKVEQCIANLKTKTGAAFSLARFNRTPAHIAKYTGTSDFYFRPQDEDTNIYVELSVNDYIKAVKSGYSTLGKTYPAWRGILDGSGNPMSVEKALIYVNNMLKSRYNGFLY